MRDASLCYHKGFAPLLEQHMKQGYSLESFAGLRCTKADVSQQTDGARFEKESAFEKQPVPLGVVHGWLVKHPRFRQAYERGQAQGLLFYEQLLVEALLGTSKVQDKVALQWALYVLRSRFGRCYEQTVALEKQQEQATAKSQGQVREDLTQINDPDELMKIAKRCFGELLKEGKKGKRKV